jgi:hypothetical protein
MKKPTAAYRAVRSEGRIIVERSTVKAWGEKDATLVESARAWRWRNRVPISECFLTPAEAFDAEHRRLRNEARDYRESADELDKQVARADVERDASIAAALEGT